MEKAVRGVLSAGASCAAAAGPALRRRARSRRSCESTADLVVRGSAPEARGAGGGAASCGPDCPLFHGAAVVGSRPPRLICSAQHAGAGLDGVMLGVSPGPRSNSDGEENAAGSRSMLCRGHLLTVHMLSQCTVARIDYQYAGSCFCTFTFSSPGGEYLPGLLLTF